MDSAGGGYPIVLSLWIPTKAERQSHSALHSSSKCCTYQVFKSMLDVETYLTLELPLHLRTLIAKFRCSNSNLMIEIGRHKNIPRSERLCTFCLSQGVLCIENEFHLLLCCPAYSELRHLYIQPYYHTMPTIAKFTQLMQTKERDTLFNIAIYFFKANP